MVQASDICGKRTSGKNTLTLQSVLFKVERLFMVS